MVIENRASFIFFKNCKPRIKLFLYFYRHFSESFKKLLMKDNFHKSYFFRYSIALLASLKPGEMFLRAFTSFNAF